MVKRSPVLRIGLMNLTIACLGQWYTASLLNDGGAPAYFQFFYMPLLLVGVNLLLWVMGRNIPFHHYWLSLYFGYACSLPFFYFILSARIDSREWSDFPPGEAYWDLFLTVFIYGFLQLIILCCLNMVAYILSRLFRRLFLVSSKTYE